MCAMAKQDIQATLNIVDDLPELSIEKVDAAVCGRLGCTVNQPLYQARADGIGTRVVCGGHLSEFVKLAPGFELSHSAGGIEIDDGHSEVTYR